MTGKDKHMPLYSSSDIEKYLSGELSASEMHAMERAALDDPFLADALEGMAIHRSIPEHPSFQQDMAGLQKRLNDRVSRGKTWPLQLSLIMRYAAALILLLGLGITAYYTLYYQKMEKASLATSKVVPHVPDTFSTPPAALSNTPPAPAVAAEDRVKAAPEKDQLTTDKGLVSANPHLNDTSRYSLESARYSNADAPTSYKNDFSALSRQPPAPHANNLANNRSNLDAGPVASRLTDSLSLRRDSLSEVLNNSMAAKDVQKAIDLPSYKPSSDQMVFTGKVINPQNVPLAGATLSLKKGHEYVNTVTDANGNFTLRISKKDSTSRVAVNYIGYEPGYMKLSTDDKMGNVIQLKPQSASLNEVVVVGFGSKRKELTKTDINSTPQPLSEIAVPTEGWPSYTNYLESHKNSSQIDTTIRGYESISFIVNKKGELSSFRVERSLSSAHDSLAIRLVKEGPSWKLLKGKKERARVVLTW